MTYFRKNELSCHGENNTTNIYFKSTFRNQAKKYFIFCEYANRQWKLAAQVNNFFPPHLVFVESRKDKKKNLPC